MSIRSSILAFLREVDTMFEHARTGRPPSRRTGAFEGRVNVWNVDGWANDQARRHASPGRR